MNPPAPPKAAPARKNPEIPKLEKAVETADQNQRQAQKTYSDLVVSKEVNKKGREDTALMKLDEKKEITKNAKEALEKAKLLPAVSPTPQQSIKPEKGRYRLSIRGITGTDSGNFVGLCIVELK